MMNKNGIIATTTNRNVVPSSTSTSSSTTTDNSFSTNSNNVKIISTSSLLNDSNDWWIDQVLELQKSNHKHELVGQDDDNNEMKSDDGFLTVRHEKSDLIEMAKYCPQFLAVDDDSDDKDHPKVIGYTLTVDRNTLDKCPNLSKLYKIFFDMTDDVVIIEEDDATTATDAGSSSSSLIKDMNWVLGAQVCVSKDYRRRGILQKLYDMQMNQLSTVSNNNIDAIVTAVDHANNASLKAHSKAKFDTLKRFDTGGKDNTGWSLIIRTSNQRQKQQQQQQSN